MPFRMERHRLEHMEKNKTAVASGSVHEADVKLPFKTKFSYGLGDFGNNFNWTFVSSFLMFFYTDVFGISAAAVATLMLVARLWDAVNDPIIGGLADRTKSRWGRYRPWSFFATIPTAILLVLLYWAHPSWGENAKIIYMYVTYCLLVLSYTCVNIPYSAMTGVMTQNIDERAALSGTRLTMAICAINLIGVIVLPLVGFLGKGNQQQGFLMTAILFGCILIACQAVTFKNCREVVEPPKNQRIPLGIQIKTAFMNRPFVIAFLGQMVFGFSNYGRAAVYLYYFKYYANNMALFTAFSFACIIPAILGAASFRVFYGWFGHKGKATGVASIISGIFTIAMFLTHPVNNPVGFFALAILGKYFASIASSGYYAVIPDTVEYGEWKFGIRNDGFLSAFVTLGNKIGMAVGTFGVAAVLAAMNYTPNMTATPEMMSTMNHMMTTIPGAVYILTGLLFFLYNIDRKSFAKMVTEIRERKAAEEAQVQTDA